MLADVVPLGLVKPDPCLNTALSSEFFLGGDTSGTGVRSCRCLRFSGELGAGGTCSSLHPRCPELQKELKSAMDLSCAPVWRGLMGAFLWPSEEFLDITEMVLLEQCPAALNVPDCWVPADLAVLGRGALHSL